MSAFTDGSRGNVFWAQHAAPLHETPMINISLRQSKLAAPASEDGDAGAHSQRCFDRLPRGNLHAAWGNEENVIGLQRDILLTSFENALEVHGNFGAGR